MNKIITIGREFGSGGRELGQRLAEKLGIAYYDGEIIRAIAERSALAEDYVKQVVEKSIKTYYPITVANTFSAAFNSGDSIYAINRSIYAAQTEILNEMAEKSDCVIVGRCSGHVLEAYHPFRVFVYAPIEARIARCRAKGEDGEGLSDRELEKKIRAVDKSRGQYFRFYTGRNWLDFTNYDVCINTAGVELDAAAEALSMLVKNR